jgi:hypothetical protein
MHASSDFFLLCATPPTPHWMRTDGSDRASAPVHYHGFLVDSDHANPPVHDHDSLITDTGHATVPTHI